MSIDIDLNKSKKIAFESLTSEANLELSKGWSFSYVYFMRELRDIYLIIEKYGFGTNSFIITNCNKERIYPERKEGWTERNILERVNALKNFGLISNSGDIIQNNLFKWNLENELSIEDKLVFKSIYFNYFRFREIMTWLVDPYDNDRLSLMRKINEDFVLTNSKVIFPFISEGRFTNTFFYELKNNTDIFYIEEKNSDLMRFWDVFVKWGTALDLIDKFQLKWVDVDLMQRNKSLTCVYFKRKNTENFSLLDFISSNYKSKYLYIPQIILDILIYHRFSLNDIKDLIVNQCLENKDILRMQRTSEIFVQEKEKILLPIYRNSYISHLLIL